MAENEMLVLKDLRKTFNPGTVMRKMALAGVDLTLNKGDFVTVIGGNGAGKSTMLNAIAGTFQILLFSIYTRVVLKEKLNLFQIAAMALIFAGMFTICA